MKNKELSLLRRNTSGFTLIEMMIVVSIIALLLAIIGTNVSRKFDTARVDTTKIQMKQLLVILDDFKRVCGFYPSTEQGLDALLHAPSGRECKNYDPEGFIKGGKIPQDAWNNDFLYSYDGRHAIVRSLGADTVEGGDDVNKDISSEDL